MSFFIKPGSKRGSNPRKKPHPKSGKKPQKKKVADEELSDIPSTDDEEIPSDEAGGTSPECSDNEDETPQEKRLRLAKQYLSQIEAEIDDSDEDGDHISQRLKDDYKKMKGRHYDSITESISYSEENTFILRGHKLAVTCLVVSNDNRYVYSGSKDSTIIKWDIQQRKKLKVIQRAKKDAENPKSHKSHVTTLALSDNNKYLVSGDRDGKIHIWKPDNMEYINTFTGHRSAVMGLAFRLESNQLFSCSTDRSVKIWTLDEMAFIETLYGHQDQIQGIDGMMKERTVTCGGRDSSVRIWKILDESQIVFQGPGCSLDCVSMIDEERFITGSDHNQIHVWNISKKKPVAYLPNAHKSVDGNDCWITSVRSLRNTDLAASGSNDGQIRLWKISKQNSTPQLITTVPVCGYVNDIRFTKNGEYLCAAVGQEHKHGRWWKDTAARNCILISKLH